MTVAEFIALPDDDGVDRMLIQGQLWEKPMTERDRWHSGCQAAIAYLLGDWWKSQPRPRGKVLSGGAGFILQATLGSVVGIDVAYTSHEVISRNNIDNGLIDGPPVLAVEILSPNDKQDEVTSKVREYLDVGVALVWVVEPVFQTVNENKKKSKD
eukprot:TRINITY_DN17663_c2_g1_i1.p1 TRINITY_DN17663_c2_g1~~TRINITY_DN17663_c2_g1_i1.p1  ORF type:complete len:155 (+),score=2.01 TRINITY_DN17663_c2_g1_i1:366-830(+)